MPRPLLLLLLLAGACTEYQLKGDDDVGVDTGTHRPPPWDTAPPRETGDTGSRPDCSAFETPEAYEVAVDEGCLREPEIGDFDPVIEWQWSANPIHPGYEHVMATPVVAELTDDDGDGDIDTDDVPDIVFTAFTGNSYNSPGRIVCISGDGSGTHWSHDAVGGRMPLGSSGVAVGDLDGDGTPEILFGASSGELVCMEADGDLRWAVGAEIANNGCPSIADLDGDGRAEVLYGRQVFDADGNLLGQGSYGSGGSARASFAVDMDGDGQLEVVAGNAVYEMDGSALWARSDLPDGTPAVGDFDGDAEPEVVVSGSGSVRLLDTDGTLLWSTALPGGGNGGAPTVADFDGDGDPEVGVAGLGAYTVFETDGSLRWSQPTEDDSSSVTGSSVFDFEGDGKAEVVYADEHVLYIYDGTTGKIRVHFDDHASGTLWEYPLVVDVDGDGATEIVVASNDYAWPGWQGITVIGDASDSWADSRPVWNQFAYFITNVNDDGSIPAVQVENWLTWNNFRAGGTSLGPSHWLPDVAPGETASCLEECWGARAYFALSVYNQGLLDAEPFTVGLYKQFTDTEQLVWQLELPGLASGESTWLGPIELDYADWGDLGLVLRVDDGGALDECDETNNELELGPWPCSAR